jgi:hypothetical protein
MDQSMKTRFTTALKLVERIAHDPLDEVRLRTYWIVLGPRCTIEEFEAACLDVLAGLTERWVPMPGVFMQTIDALREQARQAQARAAQHASERAWHAQAACRERLLADPRMADEEASAMRECMRQLEGILGREWRTFAELDAAGSRRTSARQSASASARETPQE